MTDQLTNPPSGSGSNSAAADQTITSKIVAGTDAWENFSLPSGLVPLRPEFKPYNFQDFAIYKSLSTSHFVFGLGTGLGKTLCSYLSFHYFQTKFAKTRLIIITTASAVLQFSKEHDKFFDTDLRVQAIHPNMGKMGCSSYAAARKRAYQLWGNPQQAHAIEVIAMNYSVYRSDIKLILSEMKRLKDNGYEIILVGDEATSFKNTASETHACIHAACTNYVSKPIALTATLTKGKLEEIYGIFRAVGVQITRSKKEFYERFCYTIDMGPKRPPKVVGYKNIDQLIELIRPYSIILRKIDVAKYLPQFLPPVVHKVEQDETTFNLIKDVYAGKLQVGAQSVEGEIDPSATTSEGNKNVQRLTEAGYIKRALMDPGIVMPDANFGANYLPPKTRDFIDFLDEQMVDEKIVFYTPSKRYLKRILHQVRTHPNLPSWYKNALEISGDISAKDREHAKGLFQDGNNNRLIGINDAGLEAINLQSASVLCLLSMPVSGGNLIQLAGRLSRLGSSHTALQIHYFLQQGSQDEDEYLIIQQQMQLMASILGESEKGLIDWDLLKRAEADKLGIHEADEISNQDLVAKSMASMTLYTRKRRERLYRATYKDFIANVT